MITVDVVFATAARQQVHRLTVSPGTRARELVISVTAQKLICLDESSDSASSIAIGVYGQLVDDDYLLADGDRLEIYRPLQQDPKELRRQRAEKEKRNNSGAGRRNESGG